MRVLVAPDRFGDLLTAGQAAEAIALGWRATAPHDELRMLALGDGGPGWLGALEAAFGPRAATHVLTVPDPWGRPVPAEMVLAQAPARQPGPTAYLEAAQILGGHTRRDGDDPAAASSRGLGLAITAAVTAGARRIVVGLSGSLVLDAGFGVLGALGAEPGGLLRGGALALARLAPGELRWPERTLSGVRLVGAGELDQPLLGLRGVAATWGRSAGADPELAQRIEGWLGHAVELARRARPEPTDLLTGAVLRADRVPGAGAGAGLGFAFALLGAQLQDGPDCAARELGLEAALDGVDLLVTGTEILGWESLRGSAVTTAAAAAQRRGIPVLVVSGRIAAGRRESMAAGIDGAYAVCASLAQWPSFAARPAQRLADRVAALARTWSPRNN